MPRLIRENISLEAYGSKFPNQVETEKVWIYQTRYTTGGKARPIYQELPADYSEFSVKSRITINLIRPMAG